MNPLPNDPWQLDVVAGWLLREGWRMQNRRLLFQEIAQRLIGEGVPIWRMAAYIPTLHPELFADAFFWRSDTKRATYVQAQHQVKVTEEFQASPLHEVTRTGQPLRRKLTGPAAQLDFPFLQEIASQGATEHYIAPVFYANNTIVHLSFTTNSPGGFSDAHIKTFDDLAVIFAPIVEAFSTNMMAARLLDTYVGHNAGQRVLTGQIVRGSGETLRAALWYCDLRGFTALSDQLPRDQLIATLNAYFDCMGEAIEQQHGEVLKFIGDAMLAIFPVAGDEQAACVSAFAAARQGLAAMDKLNQERAGRGESALAFGIALHIGDVMYGNIGTKHRLDFTVIGPAVNFAARLEAVCRQLGQRLVISEPVARHLGDQVSAIGQHTLRSIPQPQALFIPAS